MSTSDDIAFYTRRERQETALADRAVNPEGRNAHLELARRYASLIAEGETHKPRIPAR